jgi:nucleotide-binding universal stress UspA family protein
MFERILFATTASPTCDDAARVAFDLALKYDSEKLFVFHVLGYPTRGYSQFVTDSRTGEEETISPDYVDWVKDEMMNTYGTLMEGLDSCELETQVGVPSTQILRMAREKEANLIVMGAHTRKEDVGATRYRGIVGSTMQQVAQRARCPVLIVSRPCTTCFKLFSHIVFATDFSKAADSAFKFALEAVRDVGARFYLFHSVDITPAQAGKPEAQSHIEKRVEDAQKKMEEKYVSKMGEFDNYEVAIWEGVPYVEILKYARDKQADLIVMAHHTKDVDPEKAQLGSVVEQVVLRSSCPVVSVNRPDKLADAP